MITSLHSNAPATLQKRQEPFLELFVRWSWLVLGVLALLQSVLFCTVINLLAVGAVLLAWLVATKVFLQPKVLFKFPLSTFLVIGFIATQFYFPLLFTLLEGKPITYNLLLPEQVFFHSTAALAVLTVSHAIYRLLCNSTRNNPPTLLLKAGLFTPASDLQLWLMGLLGMAATCYLIFFSEGINTEVSGSALGKFIQGMMPFFYAPYFIPIRQLYGNKAPNIKKLLLPLAIYTLLLLLLSIGRNSRGSFMLGFTSVIFAYGLGLLLGIFKPQIFTLKNFLIALACGLFVTGPLADLGTAMVIVRGQRNGVPTTELMEQTIQAFGDKAAIAARRAEDKLEENDWDERYLDNVFTARFANIKFNDASLFQAAKISPQDPGMLDYSIDYILGSMPTPLLNAFQIHANKDAVYSVSIGDYLYVQAGGGTEALGGFRTGHFAGTGKAAFGWWYLPLLFIGILPVYYLFDRLCITRYYDALKNNYQSRFSLCGLLIITSIFQFLPSESIVTIATFLLRGWVQSVLLYAFIFHLTRAMLPTKLRLQVVR